MQFSAVGLALMVDDPTAAGRWFADHLGFTMVADLGWYVTTRHDGHEGLSVDFMTPGAHAWPERMRGQAAAGTLLAFLVDDVDAEARRLEAAGVEVLLPPVSEPWGQRRVQVAGPEGVVVEVLQLVDPDPAWMAANGLAAQD